MQKYLWIIGGTLGLALALYGLGYGAGRRSAEPAIAAIAAELELARSEADRNLVDLRSALDDAQARAGRVGSGLEEAARIAAGITDRSRRIAVLIDGIQQALDDIRAGPP